MKYSHTYDFAFPLISDDPETEFTLEQLITGLRLALADPELSVKDFNFLNVTGFHPGVLE